MIQLIIDFRECFGGVCGRERPLKLDINIFLCVKSLPQPEFVSSALTAQEPLGFSAAQNILLKKSAQKLLCHLIRKFGSI